MSVTTGQEGVAEDDTVLDVLLRYGADQAVEEGLLGLTAFEFAKHENVHDIAAKIHHYGTSFIFLRFLIYFTFLLLLFYFFIFMIVCLN